MPITKDEVLLNSLYIDVTWEQLNLAKTTLNLIPGQVYRITDRYNYQSGGSGLIPNQSFLGDDRGIVYIRALTNSELNKEVVRIMACPKYYDTNIHDGNNWAGIYKNLVGDSANDYVIWGSKVWLSTVGSIGAVNDDYTLLGGHSLIAKTDANFYEDKQFNCIYDFDNDWFDEQRDNASNKVGVTFNDAIYYYSINYNPCDFTDWNMTAGRELNSSFFNNNQPLGVLNNLSPFIYDNKNGYIKNNATTSDIYNNADKVYNNNNSGNIANNSIGVTGLGSDVTYCRYDQVRNNGGSFEYDITLLAGILNIPYSDYQKEIVLVSTNPTENITEFVTLVDTVIQVESGLIVTFVHNPSFILCEGGVDAVINGANSDFIHFKKDYNGKFKQINVGTY